LRADRLDSVRGAAAVDERHHHVPRRSSSAWAKYADALRRFNILSAHSELERLLIASDLVAVFRRLSTSFGDQMVTVLANAILAFLESDDGGTLLDLRRFLVEKSFRKTSSRPFATRTSFPTGSTSTRFFGATRKRHS